MGQEFYICVILGTGFAGEENFELKEGLQEKADFAKGDCVKICPEKQSLNFCQPLFGYEDIFLLAFQDSGCVF